MYIPLKKFCDELVKNNITLRESDVAAIVNRIEEEASRISQTVRIQKAYEEAARQFVQLMQKVRKGLITPVELREEIQKLPEIKLGGKDVFEELKKL